MYNYKGKGKAQKFKGSCVIKPSRLFELEFSNNALPLANKVKNKNAGFLKVESVKETFTFAQLLTHGLNFSVAVCFDFSRKKRWKIPKSCQHDTTQDEGNLYQKLTQSFLEILQYYDKDKLVPLFGLAGVSKEDTMPKDFFELVDNRIGSNIKEVQDIYEMGACQVRDGMALRLGPSLREIKRMSEREFSEDSMNYSVCVYFIRNGVEDLDEFKEFLGEFEDLALSVIIVGLGEDGERFEGVRKAVEMENRKLVGGRKKSFVFEFFECGKCDVKRFRRMVLSWLPEEIRKFYERRMIDLEEREELSYDQFLRCGGRRR